VVDAALLPPTAQRSGHVHHVADGVWIRGSPISGGLALLLLPFILGPLGMIFGFVAKSKGDRIGKWAGLMSIATTVLGLAFSIWVAGHVRAGFRG
jgi:hypothetical protein